MVSVARTLESYSTCRRFKIYSCPHCSDKYCTQEDLERHLIKVHATPAATWSICFVNIIFFPSLIQQNIQVERNNVVKGVAGAGAPGVPVPMEARQQGVQAREASEPAEGPAEGAVDGAGAGEAKIKEIRTQIL